MLGSLLTTRELLLSTVQLPSVSASAIAAMQLDAWAKHEAVAPQSMFHLSGLVGEPPVNRAAHDEQPWAQRSQPT